MPKIGIVSNDKFINIIKEDLMLKEELIRLGIEAEIISWEDQTIDYSRYDCLILKSVWGYHNRYKDFKNWLNYLEKNNIKIFNSVDIIKNNIRKDIQFNILDRYNIAHIPTIFQNDISDISMISNNKVIKPIISGSGNNTIKSEELEIERYKSIILEEDNGLMIQPFIKEIENGEYSIIFIDGENTHNMIRFPGIFYKKIKPYEVKNIPPKVLKLAYEVKNITEYSEALYMRVDIVNTKNPMIMEVELAEPDLLTRNINSREPIKKLAKGLKKRL